MGRLPTPRRKREPSYGTQRLISTATWANWSNLRVLMSSLRVACRQISPDVERPDQGAELAR
jgi:hypothetical protein